MKTAGFAISSLRSLLFFVSVVVPQTSCAGTTPVAACSANHVDQLVAPFQGHSADGCERDPREGRDGRDEHERVQRREGPIDLSHAPPQWRAVADSVRRPARGESACGDQASGTDQCFVDGSACQDLALSNARIGARWRVSVIERANVRDRVRPDQTRLALPITAGSWSTPRSA